MFLLVCINVIKEKRIIAIFVSTLYCLFHYSTLDSMTSIILMNSQVCEWFLLYYNSYKYSYCFIAL